jgi:hypothetical protein
MNGKPTISTGEMMMNSTNHTLNKRALVFFYLIFSGVILPISGLMLHASSSDRVKFIAMVLHNMAAIVFTITSIVHVRYNWKPIVNYVQAKHGSMMQYRRELAIVSVTIISLLILGICHLLVMHE